MSVGRWLLPRRVKGVFETGMEEADGFLIQVPLGAARRIFRLGPDQATRIGLVLESPKLQERALLLQRYRYHHETGKRRPMPLLPL